MKSIQPANTVVSGTWGDKESLIHIGNYTSFVEDEACVFNVGLADWEISMLQPGAFFAIFQSFLPLVYSFVHNFV